MVVSVRMFAALRDLAGESRTTVEAGTVGEALAILCERYGPRWAEVVRRSAVLLDGEPGRQETGIGDGEELTLLPPVSGG